MDKDLLTITLFDCIHSSDQNGDYFLIRQFHWSKIKNKKGFKMAEAKGLSKPVKLKSDLSAFLVQVNFQEQKLRKTLGLH